MLGIFRNCINLAKPPINVLRSSQVLSRSGIDGFASTNSCQQCNVVNNNGNTFILNWSQFAIRFLGTFGINGPKPEILGAFVRNAQFSDSPVISAGGPFNIQVRGMKYKAKAKRRCKDCYLQWIHGMLYNLCKTKPRHKHGMKPAYYSNQRCMTHATMSPKRPW